MKKLFILASLMMATYQSYAQTLKIELVENLFTYNKIKLLDTLKSLDYQNLTDEEIFQKSLRKDPYATLLQTKQAYYNAKNIRRVYELKRVMGGGVSEITIMMQEPSCNKLSTISWNANLRWSVNFYIKELERLGYVMSRNDEYRNETKGFYITVIVKKEYNEITFIQSKIQK